MDAPPWHFYLPDSDRSTGWTNHCYVLQHVASGYGIDAAQAWADVKANGRVPEGFHLPDDLIAIPARSEVQMRAT